MNIGITYDLRIEYLARGYSPEDTAEFDKVETIDAIEDALISLGHATRRIGNVTNMIRLLAEGERWDMVFNIAEGMYGIGREAQIPAILDACEIPYTFSDPLVLALCLHKGMTKRVIRDLKIPTPDFALVEIPEDINGIFLPCPLFAKPAAEGTSKGISGISMITNHDEMRQSCLELLEKFRQPVLVERYLPGREFTVGIVGTGMKARALGAIEIILEEGAEGHSYSYSNKANFQDLIRYEAVEDETAQAAMETALNAWRGLGCRDGGRVDLRCDSEGIPNFIEVNPLAGLNPDISDLPILCRLKGIEYRDLIGMILESTLERIHPFQFSGKEDTSSFDGKII